MNKTLGKSALIVMSVLGFAVFSAGCVGNVPTDQRHFVDRAHVHVTMYDPNGQEVFHNGDGSLDIAAASKYATFGASSPWVTQNTDGTLDFYYDLGSASDYWETAGYTDPPGLTLSENSPAAGTQVSTDWVATDDFLSSNETISPANNVYYNAFTWNISVNFTFGQNTDSILSFSSGTKFKAYVASKYAPLIGVDSDIRTGTALKTAAAGEVMSPKSVSSIKVLSTKISGGKLSAQ